MREPDAAFADPRQAVLYDVFDDDRSDLDAYAAIVREVGARRVVDLGCGTGSLAVRLAGEGISVVGVDPAGASLDVARTKPYADGVTWINGDATALAGLPGGADLAVMTGNVAQVFVTDQDWSDTLTAVHTALRPGGWFVFETRRPEVRAWEDWDNAPTTVDLPDGRTALVTRTVTAVDLPLVTFEGSTTIGEETLTSTSTLRFRSREEIERDLVAHGFTVEDVRDAPDRPGKEHVFLARAGSARPEIVCLCGSTRFADEMAAANRDLTFAGVIVLAPGVFLRTEDREAGRSIPDEQKAALDALHLRKIDLADRVLVVNPGGYIGESTSREIAYARATGKPVSFTDRPSDRATSR